MDFVFELFYLLDINIRKVYKLKFFVEIKDLFKNFEVVVGIGD